MSIITKMRKQKAVYWALEGRDSFGQPYYLPPVEIDCRWDDVSETFVTREGQEVQSMAKVYPDRELDLEGLLLKTTLTSVEDRDNPHNPDNGQPLEVRRFDTIPNFRNTENLFIAYL